LFSNQFWYYKDLFFNVFSITNTENKVSDKYKIKNNKTDDKELFLERKNQPSANIISSSNFNTIATKV